MNKLEIELAEAERILSKGGAKTFGKNKKFTIYRFYNDRHLNPKPINVIFRLDEYEKNFENGGLEKQYSNLSKYCNCEE